MAHQSNGEVTQFIDPKSYTFVENLTLDLHDLASIVLRERLLTEPRFKHSRLFEVCDGSWPASCLPVSIQAEWMDRSAPKVGYFLQGSEKLADSPIEPNNFLHPNIKCSRELDSQDVETIYWRIKHHDSGYTVCHSLQLVLDTLPESTLLRVRTSQGHALTCKARSFVVAEMEVIPKQTTYICDFRPRPDLGPYKVDLAQFTTGDHEETTPWVYLAFGETEVATGDIGTDGRIAVDLVAPILGMRGLGGEPFAMERLGTYHNKILASVADEDIDYTLSGRINPSEEEAGPSKELAMRVLARLERITRGEETYCSYCGKEAPKAQCSRCRGKAKARKAWTYHKMWCKIDGASDNNVANGSQADVVMADA
ncbi:hypothetical protein DFH11DRAFT_1593999 [Phellopilus nigrolimitatus]|nr:hypothetical protein DFH11DRAFT_1593999 [Phellopilus nigrolimitatus]